MKPISEKIVIHAIDTVSVWIAISGFIVINWSIKFVANMEFVTLDSIFYIGFTTKAALLSVVLAPLYIFVMRLFKRTNFWDLFLGTMAISAFAILLRFGSCVLGVYGDHVYASSFDPLLDYQTQCAYYSLLNFVISVPKMMLIVLVFGLMRSFLARLFGARSLV